MADVQWDIRQKLIDVQHSQAIQGEKLDHLLCHFEDVAEKLCGIEKSLGEIEYVLKQLFALVIGQKLVIKFQKEGESVMAGKKNVTIQMQAKGARGGAARQIGPPVDWTSDLASITLQLLDATGAPITNVDPVEVTTTLAGEDGSGGPSPLVTAAAGADSLHWTLSKAGPSGVFTLKAHLDYVSGSPGPFDASCVVTIPPGVQVPSDLAIIFGQ